MSSKAESAIRTDIVTNINRNGGWAMVVSGGTIQAGGIPDILASVWSKRGQLWIPYGLEVKTDRGEPSARQKEVLRIMGKKGFAVGVVTSYQQLDTLHTYYGMYHAKYASFTTFGGYAKLINLEDKYEIWE